MKNILHYFAFVFCISVLVLTNNFSSQELGLFEFTDESGCPHNPNTTVNVQPSNAVFSAFSTQGTVCYVHNLRFSNSGWNTSSTIDLNEYNQFTITPDNGYVLNLSSIVVGNHTGSATTVNWFLRSSLDNYASDIYAGQTTNDWAFPEIFLVGFTNISAPITFRFYVTNIDSDASYWRQDDIMVNGTVSAAGGPVTWYADVDNDGFGDPNNSEIAVTSSLPNATQTAGDCNDNDNTIYTGAPEICDGLDNNCDGTSDEGLTFLPYYVDNDLDGFGELNSTAYYYCTPPAFGFSDNATDCNDNNPEIYQNVILYLDIDSDMYAVGEGLICMGANPPNGYSLSTLGEDCNDADATINPNATDIPNNGIDENCDGSDATGGGVDNDNDGYNSTVDCDDFNPNVYQNVTVYIDNDMDGFDNGTSTICMGATPPNGYSVSSLGLDCDDFNANANPNASEVCDGYDNNCDGNIDEFLGTIYYVDTDNDTYGSTVSAVFCSNPGVGYSTQSGDCNDTDSAINPSATDIAGNGIDEDCNGSDAPLINVAPDAIDDFGTDLTQDGPDGSINILLNDTDPNGNPSAPTNGVGQFYVDIDPILPGVQTSFVNPLDGSVWSYDTQTGILTCNPADGFAGTVNCVYTLCDPLDACDANPTIVTFVVNSSTSNNQPVATDDDGGSLTQDGADGTVSILQNDTDADGNPSTSSGHTVDLDPITPGVQHTFTSPIDGTVWTYNPSTGELSANPADGFNGTTSTIYILCDDQGACDNATVTFTVTPTSGNQTPNAQNDFSTTTLNNNVTITVLNNDSDPDGDDLVVTIVSPPSNGSVVVNGDGSITYSPDNGFVGTDLFTYQICDDGTPALCDEATVTIIVNEISNNNAPVANDDSESGIENGVNVLISILLNDTDADGNPSAFSGHTVDLNLLEAGLQSTFTGTSPDVLWSYNSTFGTLSCDPGQDVEGTVSLTYELCDSDGLCDQATVTVTITPSTAGISEESKIFLMLFPNPASNTFQIVSNEEIVSIQITHLNGEFVMESESSIVDIKNLTSGLYFVVLKNKEGKAYTQKLIKN